MRGRKSRGRRVVLKVEGLELDVPGRTLLKGVDLTLAAGECVAVVGPSGSGKTSLLNSMAGLSVARSGRVVVGGTEITGLSAARRSAFRLTKIGMVFQFGELLPELTAVENVALPSRLMGVPKGAAEDRARAWLDQVGLAEQFDSHPDSLSGGERQRVGLARAMAHGPVLLLADEPTGMLDDENSHAVVDLLISTAHHEGAAVLLTTHDSAIASMADRVLRIHERSLVAAPRERLTTS